MQHYDVIVCGAGPAGAMAAFQIARKGLKVLLVEKERFPRRKVCGCCLSHDAINTLVRTGLSAYIPEFGKNRLHDLVVCHRTKRISFPLEEGQAISRSALDNALVQAAVKSGCEFKDGVTAHRLHTTRDLVTVKLTASAAASRFTRGTATDALDDVPIIDDGIESVTANLLLCADGLAGTTLGTNTATQPVASPNSRIGIGAISTADMPSIESGTIYMTHARGGYVGMVRLEDGSIDIAAAVDPGFLRKHGTSGRAVRHLLNSAKMPVPSDIDELSWQGTVSLTRHRAAVADHRTFIIGDAASYVEPFTGEGIAWALLSGEAVAPLAVRGAQEWSAELQSEWQSRYERLIGKRQMRTRFVAALLRNYTLADLSADILCKLPKLAQPLASIVTAPSKAEDLQWQ